MTITTSWDVFEDLRYAQDEHAADDQDARASGWPSWARSQAAAMPARPGLPPWTSPSAKTPTW